MASICHNAVFKMVTGICSHTPLFLTPRREISFPVSICVSCRMNEWVAEWMNELQNEWMSCRMNEWVVEWKFSVRFVITFSGFLTFSVFFYFFLLFIILSIIFRAVASSCILCSRVLPYSKNSLLQFITLAEKYGFMILRNVCTRKNIYTFGISFLFLL